MKKEVLYSLKGIYRENFEIEGYRFGHESNDRIIYFFISSNLNIVHLFNSTAGLSVQLFFLRYRRQILPLIMFLDHIV